ncbi:hypothetical protein NSND_50457 [Nitrospira sp. ND1]|nr:hypothetical protein NSND_50457 [Nitrospira sp. ND1]
MTQIFDLCYMDTRDFTLERYC